MILHHTMRCSRHPLRVHSSHIPPPNHRCFPLTSSSRESVVWDTGRTSGQMRTSTSTTMQVKVLARVAVIVIAFILGHDALMVLPAHASDTSAHAVHHEMVSEMCVAADALATPPPGTSLLPNFTVPTIALETTAILTFIATDHAPIIAIDGSTQRALLQVFLN